MVSLVNSPHFVELLHQLCGKGRLDSSVSEDFSRICDPESREDVTIEEVIDNFVEVLDYKRIPKETVMLIHQMYSLEDNDQEAVPVIPLQRESDAPRFVQIGHFLDGTPAAATKIKKLESLEIGAEQIRFFGLRGMGYDLFQYVSQFQPVFVNEDRLQILTHIPQIDYCLPPVLCPGQPLMCRPFDFIENTLLNMIALLQSSPKLQYREAKHVIFWANYFHKNFDYFRSEFDRIQFSELSHHRTPFRQEEVDEFVQYHLPNYSLPAIYESVHFDSLESLIRVVAFFGEIQNYNIIAKQYLTPTLFDTVEKGFVVYKESLVSEKFLSLIHPTAAFVNSQHIYTPAPINPMSPVTDQSILEVFFLPGCSRFALGSLKNSSEDRLEIIRLPKI